MSRYASTKRSYFPAEFFDAVNVALPFATGALISATTPAPSKEPLMFVMWIRLVTGNCTNNDAATKRLLLTQPTSCKDGLTVKSKHTSQQFKVYITYFKEDEKPNGNFALVEGREIMDQTIIRGRILQEIEKYF